jgi:hypothetical protein
MLRIANKNCTHPILGSGAGFTGMPRDRKMLARMLRGGI